MTKQDHNPTHTKADLERLRQVIQVMADEGLSLIIDGIRLRYLDPASARLRRLWHQSRGRRIAEQPEVRFRRTLERLGPTFVKFGQIISTRPDLLPPAFIGELSKLQDQVPPVPTSQIRKEIEKELGHPVDALFKRFEDKPMAAASLAQVHRAELADGTAVAVKVRRPGIVRLVRTDIRILMYVAGQMEKHLDWTRRYRPVKLAREFADWTLRELDFEQEAANLTRFTAAFKDDEPQLVLPVVHWPLTTQGVLVAGLVEGLKLDDRDSLDQAGIDRLELARLGLRIGFKQFMLYGFFHADPHPGNMTALPPLEPGGKPRLGMYDFGMVGELSEKVRFEMVSCFLAFNNRDAEKYAQHVIDLAESTEGADLEQFRKESAAMLSGVLWKPTQHKRLGQAFYEVILAASRNGLMFTRELVLVGKAMLTLETVGLNIYPDIDLDAEMKPFLDKVYKQEFNPARLAKQATAEAFDVLYSLKHLPEDARQAMERLSRGEIGVRLDVEELRGLKLEFDRENDIRVMAIVAAAVLLASAIALGAGGLATALGKLGFVISLILIGWTFVRVSRQPRL